MEQHSSNEEHSPPDAPGTEHETGAPGIPPDDADWKRIYWITGLLGLAYIILLGLFTLLFNTPAS